MTDNVPAAPTQCPGCKGTGKLLNGQDCDVCFGSGELWPGTIQEGAPIVPPSTGSSVSPETIKLADHLGNS
jgi:hypothetical protein